MCWIDSREAPGIAGQAEPGELTALVFCVNFWPDVRRTLAENLAEGNHSVESKVQVGIQSALFPSR